MAAPGAEVGDQGFADEVTSTSQRCMLQLPSIDFDGSKHESFITFHITGSVVQQIRSPVKLFHCL